MLKKIKYAFYGLMLRTLGQTSDGIKLCFKEGLTSGKMLDYVYRNQPSGSWGIGKLLDRAFLNNAGWEAVRQRRQNLELLLGESIDDLRQRGSTISLLDVASGPGAYILSVLEKKNGTDLLARCRDYDDRWAQEGQAVAHQKKMMNVLFEQGDAFNRSEILALKPKPNLAVASGFYDWFTDDEKIKDSMRIIYDALETNGYFVVSNQASHPDLEFTEAVFLDLRKEPLRMTMRPKEKVNQWLTDMGFTVEKTLQDAQGYYSVTKARKN